MNAMERRSIRRQGESTVYSDELCKQWMIGTENERSTAYVANTVVYYTGIWLNITHIK